MKIKVLGPGCRRCEQLHQNAIEAAGRINDPSGPIEVEKVKDLDELYKMGVFVTPGLVMDDEVISAGKVPSPDEIEAEILKRLQS